MWVKKADGSFQKFDKEKVARTCLRMGTDRQTAYAIADKVEARLYYGIPTSKVLQIIFHYVRKNKPQLKIYTT